jgi:ribosomal protein S18 acetylase RimI-like enzyme
MFNMQKAKLKDIEKLVHLVESVYRGESSRSGWTTEADLLDGQRVDVSMLVDILKDSSSELFIYCDDGKIQACVHLQRQGAVAHLGMLSVSTSLQGKSIGKKILGFCEEYSKKQWQAQKVLIEVLDGRPELLSWYERRGFRKTGNTIPFPEDNRFGIPKKENLFFHEMLKNL